MTLFRFANLVLEQNECTRDYPSMHYRAQGSATMARTLDGWAIQGPGSIDFTTYFNALSVGKLRRYTAARAFYLHFEARGAAFEFVQTRTDALSFSSSPIRRTQSRFEPSANWRTFEFKLQENEGDVLIGFMLKTSGFLELRNGRFLADVDQEDLRPVELAIAVTTCRKERYVLENIALLDKEIFSHGSRQAGAPGSPEEAARHISLHVVDNGQTLEASSLSRGRIAIHPNRNVGGSGGFARGIIEALSQDTPATHILLMDDDVTVSPESIVRTYNLLRMLNDDYAEAFVSGAMLDRTVGEDQWEDLGFMGADGFCHSVKGRLRMTLLHDIVVNETHDPGPEHANLYAAWWYCCIPASTIRRRGLPLPLFIRYDDVEYGLRCAPRFVTMNGLCVWHEGFEGRYQAAVERYQATRNGFIIQAVSGVAKDADFLGALHGGMQLELKRFNYADAELMLDGFEDFLRGPRLIMQSTAESRYLKAQQRSTKLHPLAELDGTLRAANAPRTIRHDEVFRDLPRGRVGALADYLTFNGHRLPLPRQTETVLVPSTGGLHLAGKLHRARTVVMVDIHNRRAAVRTKDKRRFRRIWSRYQWDLLRYRLTKRKIERDYRESYRLLTSLDFWRHYLES